MSRSSCLTQPCSASVTLLCRCHSALPVPQRCQPPPTLLATQPCSCSNAPLTPVRAVGRRPTRVATTTTQRPLSKHEKTTGLCLLHFLVILKHFGFLLAHLRLHLISICCSVKCLSCQLQLDLFTAVVVLRRILRKCTAPLRLWLNRSIQKQSEEGRLPAEFQLDGHPIIMRRQLCLSSSIVARHVVDSV